MKTLVGLLIVVLILSLVVNVLQNVEVRILIGGSDSAVEELKLKGSDLPEAVKKEIIEAWNALVSV